MKMAKVFVLLFIVFGALALAGPVQDPLAVAPAMYKKKFENERVRVMQVTFKPGAKHCLALASGPHGVRNKRRLVVCLHARRHVASIEAQDRRRPVAHRAKAPRPKHGKTTVRLLVTELK
jgi:hypothetical protein